jgi:hypothetical protein
MGARREVVSAVAGALRVGQAGGEGAHPRRAVRDDGVASQACGARTSATQDGRASYHGDSGGAAALVTTSKIYATRMAHLRHSRATASLR